MEIFQLKIRKTVICKAASTVVSLVKQKEANSPLAIKSVISNETVAGRYPVYLDGVTEDRSSLYGLVSEIKSSDGTILSPFDVSVLLEEPYRIEVKSYKEPEFIAEMIIEKEDGSSNQSVEADADFSELIENIVASKYASKEEVEEKIKFMQKNKCDSILIKRVLSGYRNYKRRTRIPSTLYVDPSLESSVKRREEGVIAEALRTAVSRNACVLEGEKSVGKNVLCETIAWLMGMPLYLITFSRSMTPASIFGEKSTDNSASKLLETPEAEEGARAKVRLSSGNFSGLDLCSEIEMAASFELAKAKAASVNIVMDESDFADWLEDGGFMVFNEVNLAESNFLASIANPLTDGTGFLVLPGREPIKISENSVLFCTQNPVGYAGVAEQNEATMSRFGCIYLPQPASIKEQLKAAVSASLKKHGFDSLSLESSYYDQCEKFYKKCKDSVAKDILSNACLNIRGFVRALTTVAESNGYAKLKRWVEISVINTCPADERDTLLEMLDAIITL